MKHGDFWIGMEFVMAGARWRCTDVGTRTICAIKLDGRDESWSAGPPYALAEYCFDEDDFSICEPASDADVMVQRGFQMWKLKYIWTATKLLIQGKIRWEIYRMALREWPIAVAGKGGGYVLDPDFPG